MIVICFFTNKRFVFSNRINLALIFFESIRIKNESKIKKEKKERKEFKNFFIYKNNLLFLNFLPRYLHFHSRGAFSDV